ncbi:MAG: hypothetical protein ABI539_11605 [Acidobacteriota bacterium]
MTAKDLTEIVQKYSQKEITIVVKVLVDILAMQNKEDFGSINLKKEFTPAQIKRLQKQLVDHSKTKSKHLSLTQVKNALGL